jgi:hypothetical protein
LIDTGIFNEDRYFDVFVEYAKESPEDILVQISVHNRGPEAAEIHLLPTLWYRNRWSWGRNKPKPSLQAAENNASMVRVRHPELGDRYLYCEDTPTLLFTENETNNKKLFNTENRTPYVKDGIINYVVHGQTEAVNPQKIGTKAAVQYRLTVPAGKCEVVRLRLTPVSPDGLAQAYGNGSGAFGQHFESVMQTRRKEVMNSMPRSSPLRSMQRQATVMRQAFAGMLWSKQFFYFDVTRWREERGFNPFRTSSKRALAQ